MNIHSKHKGNMAHSKVMHVLHKNYWSVFTEIGDLSKIDLIAEKNGKVITLQVKYVSMVNGILPIPVKKTGPNGYTYHYSDKDVDYFAVYCPDNEQVYFISSQEICKKRGMFSLRINPPKNNQTNGINYADKYVALPI